MRNRMISWLLFLTCLSGLTACIREEEYTNDPIGNFDQLWKIIDERYCFLDYKGIDWKKIGERKRKFIEPEMDDRDLFQVLSDMLYELQDGHVNLTSTDNQTHFDFWLDSPRNFSEATIESNYYLGQNYQQTAGFKYKILNDEVGYIYYEKFSEGIDNNDLDRVFSYFSNCKGLIIDVRQNSGGNATNSAKIASRFTEKKILTGYICHKTGPGHNDFSEPYAIYLEPAKGIRWQKKVAVLTNRHSYSATNDFVNHMRCLPNVTIVGDKTGGGSGMPFSSELPNGWTIRFSASPHFDKNMNHIEWGIDPDVKVDINYKDEVNGFDTIIEEARKLLK
ncbi:S41 family peptidase [Bacteroides nordii]|uniref:Peptidase S41 n=1 Tax=Bacteroides nordii TaxID=291645 RepID=A0A413VUA8_9BACE|nr:S41 family peptidase [Bacteroides nordii]OKZ04696.1 MAG: peptidase S41 [Bacteroides sp. 41_26]RHB37118.1 peptidase S41 [Bacteroides nordii]UAK42427.1 S41 family peptidase [Bacteroides nordii]